MTSTPEMLIRLTRTGGRLVICFAGGAAERRRAIIRQFTLELPGVAFDDALGGYCLGVGAAALVACWLTRVRRLPGVRVEAERTRPNETGGARGWDVKTKPKPTRPARRSVEGGGMSKASGEA